jgi:hypothetical protein
LFCSAKDDKRLHMTFGTEEQATAEEDALLLELEQYSADTVQCLHNAFDLCGGFNGDSEVFLVPAEVLTALKHYYTTGSMEALQAALQAARDAAAHPPTDPLLLLTAVIKAGRDGLIASSTRKNSAFSNIKLISMMASARALLPDAMDPRLWMTADGKQVMYHLHLQEDVDVVAKTRKKHENALKQVQNYNKKAAGAPPEQPSLLEEMATSLKFLPTGAAADFLNGSSLYADQLVKLAINNHKKMHAAATTASLLPFAALAGGPRSIRSSDGAPLLGSFNGGGVRPPLYDASRSSRSSDGALFAPRQSGGCVAFAARQPLRVSRSSAGFIPSPSPHAGGAAKMVPGASAQPPASAGRKPNKQSGESSSLKPPPSSGATAGALLDQAARVFSKM